MASLLQLPRAALKGRQAVRGPLPATATCSSLPSSSQDTGTATAFGNKSWDIFIGYTDGRAFPQSLCSFVSPVVKHLLPSPALDEN